MYGYSGIRALQETTQYAKGKDLVVIEDGKRNDIGNTAAAYANGHLGESELLDGRKEIVMNADFLTVSPFLGHDSLVPFFNTAKKHNKGIFILVKTSNKGADLIQNCRAADGLTVSQMLSEIISNEADAFVGLSGYSPIGAVVGATYPEEAKELRKRMRKSILLVPGYGTQGGGAYDVASCYNEDGLGAIVNASRSIIFAHVEKYGNSCSLPEFKQAVREAAIEMKQAIYAALRDTYSRMCYWH